MGKGFLKFKRKLWIGAVVRALLVAFSVGIITVAIQWLNAKMTGISPDFFLYRWRGALPAVVGFAFVLLALLPTNKRVARLLDARLGLGEKVQTMLAFRRDEGDMASIQRADTDRILCETPPKKVKGACTWLFAVVPVVACFCLVGTVLVPAKEPPLPPPVVDNNFSITPWQEQALQDLIEKVKASGMEAEPKEGVVKQLESLLIKLRNTKKESVMKETVISTIESIHTIVSEHNTYDVIASAMLRTPSQAVQELGGAIDSLRAFLIGDWFNATTDALTADRNHAATLATGITQALTASAVDTSNEVHIALMAFTLGLTEVNENTTNEEISSLMAQTEETLNAALYIQTTNEEVEDDTIYTLLSIFGIKVSEVPDHVFNDPDDPRAEGDYEQNDDLDKIHGGGLGSGDMIFGSDDTIYDPEKNTYVTYGEVLDRYYARITDMLVDGNLAPELEEALSDYFAILFNGSENKENKH
jgi:hypothetical protein